MSNSEFGGMRIPASGFKESTPGMNLIEDIRNVSSFLLTMKTDTEVIVNGTPWKAKPRRAMVDSGESYLVYEVQGNYISRDTSGAHGGFKTIIVTEVTEYYIEVTQTRETY